MGKVRFGFINALALLLFGCFSRDDDAFERTIRLSISDAVTFENNENYVVGDTLVFDLKFSRYLPEEGYSNLLDIFKTTESSEFGYSFGVSKFSDFSGNFEPITIDPQFILGTKSNIYGYFGGISSANMAALLNAERQEYTSKVGVILVEQGRFKLELDFIRLSSGFDYDTISVEIEHRLSSESNLNTEFFVTEE